MRRTAVLLGVVALGCASVRGKYVGDIVGPPKPVETVRVFYGGQPVPTGYVEVGRVFTRFGRAGARDPGAQVECIRSEAASIGADAVLVYETRSEASHVKGGSFAASGGSAVGMLSGTSGVEMRYYGIALARDAAPPRETAADPSPSGGTTLLGNDAARP